MRGKLKQLEKKLNNKLEVDPGIFTFSEPNGLVICRRSIEALGYSTKDLLSPEQDGALYKAGDPDKCLLPPEHPLYKVEEGRLQLGKYPVIIL